MPLPVYVKPNRAESITGSGWQILIKMALLSQSYAGCGGYFCVSYQSFSSSLMAVRPAKTTSITLLHQLIKHAKLGCSFGGGHGGGQVHEPLGVPYGHEEKCRANMCNYQVSISNSEKLVIA